LKETVLENKEKEETEHERKGLCSCNFTLFWFSLGIFIRQLHYMESVKVYISIQVYIRCSIAISTKCHSILQGV